MFDCFVFSLGLLLLTYKTIGGNLNMVERRRERRISASKVIKLFFSISGQSQTQESMRQCMKGQGKYVLVYKNLARYLIN